MRGSLRKLGDGRWQLRVYAGIDSTGKKRQLGRVHRGTKRSAEDALRDLIAEVEAGKARPERHVTVAELLEAHITERTQEWSPNTRNEARRLTDKFIVPAMGQRDIRRVTPLQVEQLLKSIAVEKAPTAASVHRRLRAAYNDAMRWQWVDANPAAIARGVAVPARDNSAPALVDVSPAILAAVAADDIATAVLIRTAVTSGSRRGELAALRWSDLDLERGVVEVTRAISIDRTGGPLKPNGKHRGVAIEGPTKTKNRKRISIDAGTTAWLRALRTEQQGDAVDFGITWNAGGFVWAQRPDGIDHWWPDTLSARWRMYANKVGLKNVRFHDLRHAMISQLVRDGFDIPMISGRAGHANKTVTLDTYAHELPEGDRAAAEHLGRLLDS